MNLTKTKSLFLPVFGILIIIIVGVSLYLSLTQKPTLSGRLKVLQVSPLSGDFLPLKERPKFTVVFESGVNPTMVSFDLTKKEIASGKTENVPLKVSQVTFTTLRADSQKATDPQSIYTLKVKSSSNNEVVYQTNYQTGEPAPTPVASNNPILQHFLPYKAENYTLKYLSETNVYVFSFIYDPKSKEDLNTQYEKAKNDAIKFIEGNGVDVNSINIEWRHY